MDHTHGGVGTPHPSALASGPTLRDIADRAGLKRTHGPTLETVARRRRELLGVTSFILVALSVGMVLLSFEPLPAVEQLTGTTNVVRVGLVALALGFALYVIEKERHLRKIEHALVNEQAVASALMTRLDEISLLAEAGRAVTSSVDLRTSLGVVLNAASELLVADEGSIMLLEDEVLVIAAATGHAAWYLGQRQPVGEGIGGLVVRTRQPMLIDGELEMAELSHMLGHPPQRSERVLSALSVPLTAHERVLGVLNLNITQGERRYEEYDLHTLELFAQQASLAIHQATVLKDERESLRNRITEVEEMRANFLQSMAKIADPVGLGRASDGLEADPRTIVTQTADAPVANLQGVHVLLVDDDPALLRYVHQELTSRGCRVSLASDGETATSRIGTEAPDVVILDITLPVMDGWQVLAHVRQLARRPRVICLTAKNTPRDRMKAWTLGADEYIAKPFQLPDLIKALSEVAHRSETAQTDRREEALRNLFAG